jgi:hypothetical protein
MVFKWRWFVTDNLNTTSATKTKGEEERKRGEWTRETYKRPQAP